MEQDPGSESEPDEASQPEDTESEPGTESLVLLSRQFEGSWNVGLCGDCSQPFRKKEDNCRCNCRWAPQQWLIDQGLGELRWSKYEGPRAMMEHFWENDPDELTDFREEFEATCKEQETETHS